jgi:hypothetical protein
MQSKGVQVEAISGDPAVSVSFITGWEVNDTPGVGEGERV